MKGGVYCRCGMKGEDEWRVGQPLKLYWMKRIVILQALRGGSELL